MTEFKKGDAYQHFLVTKSLEIEEINCSYTELVCQKSGASIIHLGNKEDDENLFSLCFQTLPFSSNGIAHILEHTVLCGSRKFPVKDPFFAMTRRSLNTFMNAMTGQDFTCYPAASLVEKDFYNLLEVYLDAVFHPELKYQSFLQEGWRVEFLKPTLRSQLSYKGVVYNEMKGAMNNPDSRLFKAMMKHLYPDLPYAFNSGGSPEEIVDLTHEELKEFHRNYYHPSHCLFFFYGNLPLEKHLDFLQKHALHGVKKKALIPPLPLQKRFSSPVTASDTYPISKIEKLKNKDMIALGFLTCHIQNQEEALALALLDQILMENDASILKEKLLKSKLVSSANSYLDTDLSELPWILILKGVEAKNMQKIYDLIQKTLKEAEISKEVVEAALHQLEFSRTEISSSYGPYGLTLFFRTALAKQHGCDPVELLSIHTLFNTLIKKVKEPAYLKTLIDKYLLKNPHLVKLTMKPDPALEEKEAAQEIFRLKKIKEKLSLKEKKEILKQSDELKAFQKKLESQSLECLPKLELSDVPQNLKKYELFEEKVGSLKVFHSPVFTNQIIYADLFFDLPLDAASPILAIFSNFLSQVGNGKRSYSENLAYIQAYLGGFGAYLTTHTSAKNKNLSCPTLAIKGKALLRNAGKLFSLFADTIASLDFANEKRLQDLIEEEATLLQGGLNQNAMLYTISQAVKNLNPAAFLHSKWQGVDYYQMIQSLRSEMQKTVMELPKELSQFAKEIFSASPELVLTCDSKTYEFLKEKRFFGLADLKFRPKKEKEKVVRLPEPLSEGRIIASPVSFNCFAFNTITHRHKDSPALMTASQLFENKVLHPLIREQGGAYGGGAVYSTSTGNFYFYSYRDPNIFSTQKSFEEAISQIAEGRFEEKELTEAKLCALQSLDSPVSISARASTEYSYSRSQKSYEERNSFRKALLALKKEEVAAAVKRHLGNIKDKAVTSFASEELLKKELPQVNLLKSVEMEILPI